MSNSRNKRKSIKQRSATLIPMGWKSAAKTISRSHQPVFANTYKHLEVLQQFMKFQGNRTHFLIFVSASFNTPVKRK